MSDARESMPPRRQAPADNLPLLLVSVGTDHHPFDRLIEWVDRWLADGGDQRVHCVVQHGASRPPKAGEAYELLDHRELQDAMVQAAIVACHGGPGTITEARRTGHLPIVVPRDPADDEHVDDHQLRFCRHLDEHHLIARCLTEDDFHEALDAALGEPERFRFANPGRAAAGDRSVSTPARRVGELIDNLLARSPDVRQGAPAPSARPQDWPTVSVIIPTKDRPDLLREAVQSVLGQDYPGRIECLVIFDGTEPDHTLAVDGDLRTVSVTVNARVPGLAGGRNTGILAAGGELIAFCDDDDAWLPGKLRAQVTALCDAPQASLVCSGITVSRGDRATDRVSSLRHVERTDLLRSRHAELHPSTFLMRRETLLESIGLVDEGLPGSYAEDYELLLRASAHGPVLNLPAAHVRIRWHAESHFAKRWEAIACALGVLLERYADFRDVPKGYARVSGQIAFARAALGERREALRWANRTLRANPAEPRAYLALVIAARAVTAERVLRSLNKRARGV